MARKPKCECGECHTCKMREYARRKAKEKKELETREGHAERTQRLTREKKLEALASGTAEISEFQMGRLPLMLRVVDFTRIGLEVNFHREGRAACVTLSLPQRDIDIHTTSMQALKQKEGVKETDFI